MKKQGIPKREKVYSRKRWVLRRFAVFLIALLAVNHFMQLGFLLPIQGIRQVEERLGAPHGAVLDRQWTPEIHRTHLVYLTASEKAVTVADTYLSVYGWFGGFGWALDCTAGEPLYAGEMTMYRDGGAHGTVCCYYGRVDDPAIETVAVSVRGAYYKDGGEQWEEVSCLTAGPEDFLEWNGRRHFLLREVMDGNWPYDSGRHAWVVGYDDAGNVVTEFEIQEGTHSYFG